LGSKQAHHATHWPCIHGPEADAWLRAIESEISAAQWATKTRERLFRHIYRFTILPPSAESSVRI